MTAIVGSRRCDRLARQRTIEIAAFSDEIIITSAGKGSGALITAQYGEKYHRKIWIITNDRKNSV